MIIISHRGNTKGPNVQTENSPVYIKALLDKKINCEIDIWVYNNKFYMGHDVGLYEISENFLQDKMLWCHAKNGAALYKMLKNNKIHTFWHESDTHTITSRGFIWQSNPWGLTDKTIIVDLSEKPDYNLKCYGVCVDYINSN